MVNSIRVPERALRRALLTALVAIAAAGVHQRMVRAELNTEPRPVRRPYVLSDEDRALARAAWRYFEVNRLPNGLVSSAASFPATTMWDAGSQLAGMVAALELGLLTRSDFDAWLSQALAALSGAALCKGELPNKAYNAITMQPTGYGSVNGRKEIGFSAIDLGRLARWLDIISARYPEHKDACEAVTARWKRGRLVRDGQLMGTEIAGGHEAWNQEGRLGYEQYSAYGLAKLGIVAPRALDPQLFRRQANVDGVLVDVDRRDTHDSVAHNYVTSEPYVLDGLESGFQALPADFAGRVLLAQTRRTQRTGVLTAWSEDNIDRAPWFVYNTVYVDGRPWASISSAGNDAALHRGSSLKAALGWHVLFRTETTAKVYRGMRWIADPKQGVFAGFYEESQAPNRALTLNTNGIVLEALLYAKLGRPIELWAHGG